MLRCCVLETGGGVTSLVPVAESHLKVGGLLRASCRQPGVSKSGKARERHHRSRGISAAHLSLQHNSSGLRYRAELPLGPGHGSARRIPGSVGAV